MIEVILDFHLMTFLLHYYSKNKKVSEDGMGMDLELVEAIAGFPAPKDITKLRSLIGLVNWFNDANPDLKHAMAPRQSLLKKGNMFLWGDKHEAGLKKVKEIITNPEGPVLKRFDPTLPIPSPDGCFADWHRVLLGPDR